MSTINSKITNVLKIIPNTAKLIVLLDYMERFLLPTEYCIKEVTNEIMRVLNPQDMINLQNRYMSWIREHHITYAAVLNGREDMMVFYDMYVDKNTLVMPAIKSGNKEIFKRVFTDTMEMIERMVTSGNKKPKFDIKKNIWMWLDSIMVLGNYNALEIMLPRVKSIIADAHPSRITKFLVKAPMAALNELRRVLEFNNISTTGQNAQVEQVEQVEQMPNYYLSAACAHNMVDVFGEASDDQLRYVDPFYIGKSVNKKLLERYLTLHNGDIMITMPYGEVINIRVHLLGGALESPNQAEMFDYINHLLVLFDLAPGDVTFVIGENITYQNILKMVNMGLNIQIGGDINFRDSLFAYLIENGVSMEKILELLNNSGEFKICDKFILTILKLASQSLAYFLGQINGYNDQTLEISTHTLLTMLKSQPSIKPIILSLIEFSKLVITDMLWGSHRYGSAYTRVDEAMFNAMINNSFEKYILGMIELRFEHDIFVNSDNIVSAALCCNFDYFKERKEEILASALQLVNWAIIHHFTNTRLAFNCGFLSRNYRYQSYLHNAHPEMVIQVLSTQRVELGYEFALKLAVEAPETFKLVFNEFPAAWHNPMFILSGCLLRTHTFELIFNELIAAKALLDKKAITRAITLFASHGKDATIKLILSRLRNIGVTASMIDLALLTLRDRNENIACVVANINAGMVNKLHQQNVDNYASIAYLIAAYKRKTETIIKLVNSGVCYTKLDALTIRNLTINEGEYLEPNLDNKITDFNNLLLEFALKNKLLSSLHDCVVSTMKHNVNKSRFKLN
ncbi:Hypothetical protein FSTVST1_318 [Faustovirus ST1]|nr:Hypothetical protein FSTVST1_318 [Faustovirus ST1]